MQGWKKPKKRTASVLSEFIFNDFKAECHDEQMAEIDCISKQILYEKGFYPANYKKISYIQILKKEGVYKVDSMITIQLFQASST